MSLLKKSILAVVCAGMIVVPGCNSVKSAWNGMTQAGQGATAGGTIGAAVGTGVGALIGGGKGTWIGALVGGALGAGTGALVGNHMDKQQKELEKELASVRELAAKKDTTIIIEKVKDSNNLAAIRLVMGNSVLFPTNSYKLSASADATLAKVAYNLKQFPDTDVTVIGFTDNTGSEQYNQTLSQERAESVVNFLEQEGIAADRLKAIGKGEADPIVSNSTVEGRAQNRRVEIYITADKEMIQQAQQQSVASR